MTASELAADPAGAPAPIENADLSDQVQWLVDRARISDLLVEFARALDEKDWEAYVECYLPDGTFKAGEHVRFEGHDELRRVGSPRGLAQYAGTWHQSSNHAITIDGDSARSRSYLAGLHLLSDDPRDHADGGGWYNCTLRRTARGWRFATVEIVERWRAGAPLPHMSGPPTPPQ